MKHDQATETGLESRLTPEEQKTLAICEERISTGIKVFYEVGVALITIQKQKLYRESYDTFEEYMKERWGFSRQHGYRFIKSVEPYQICAQTGVVPTSERQLRPLVDGNLTRDQCLEVWRGAITRAETERGRVTAKLVEYEVQRLCGPAKRKTKPKKIALRLCFVCPYPFSDEHHIKPRKSGGKDFQSIALCPNHHRFATLIQHMLDNDYLRGDIKAYAHEHFDSAFNERVLDLLLDRSYHFSSALSDSFNLLLDQISAEITGDNHEGQREP